MITANELAFYVMNTHTVYVKKNTELLLLIDRLDCLFHRLTLKEGPKVYLETKMLPNIKVWRLRG